MTDQTPVERAAEALQGKPLTGRRELNPEQADDAARAVYEAIDTNQLVDAIPRTELGCCIDCPQKHSNGELDEQALEIALAVKNWLTGKEPQ